MKKETVRLLKEQVDHISAANHTNLCQGHDSITSPAEIWKLFMVVTEANRPGVWCGAILNLILQLVQRREEEVWCWPEEVQENVN